MGRSYAGVLGFLAFALAVARGWLGGAGTETVLSAAGLSLAAFAGIGYVTGRLAAWIVEDSVRSKIESELEAFERAQRTPVGTAA